MKYPPDRLIFIIPKPIFMKKLLTLLAIAITVSSTAQNTFQTFDIIPGQQGSSPSCLTPYNGRLYFYATDKNYNQQIWSTDGNSTPIKTISVGKLTGNALHVIGRSNRYMAVLNNKLYFAGRDANDTVNIYCTDGTNTYGIKLNTTYPTIGLFTIFKKQLYFANRSVTGTGAEIYRLNPIDNSITRVTGLSQQNSIRFSDITELNGKLMISGYDHNTYNYKLWEYNPTNNTTVVIDSTFSGSFWTTSNTLAKLVVENNTLYYRLDQYYKLYTGQSKPSIITRMNATPDDGDFIVNKSTIFYTGTSTTTGDKSLSWKNTTNQLNKQLKDVNGSNIDGIKMFGKYLASTVFITNDIYLYNNTNIWLLNGTDAPLSLGNNTDMSADPTELVEFKGSLHFISNDPQNGNELTRYTNSSLNAERLTNTVKASLAYPNPAKDKVSIDICLKEQQAITVSVTDIYGRVVYSTPATTHNAQQHTIHIPLQNLPSGIYNYAICNDGALQMASGKFVKE